MRTAQVEEGAHLVGHKAEGGDDVGRVGHAAVDVGVGWVELVHGGDGVDPGAVRGGAGGASTLGVADLGLREGLQGQAETAVQLVDGEDAGNHSDELDVGGVLQARLEQAVEPGAVEAGGVGHDVVHGFDGGGGQRAVAVVLPLDGGGREGVLARMAEGAVLGGADGGGDPDSLRAGPPLARCGESLPGAAMRGRDALGDGVGRGGVIEWHGVDCSWSGVLAVRASSRRRRRR